jgi:hypothetical protein
MKTVKTGSMGDSCGILSYVYFLLEVGFIDPQFLILESQYS